MESDCTWENGHCVYLFESALPSSLSHPPPPTFLYPQFLCEAKVIGPLNNRHTNTAAAHSNHHTHTRETGWGSTASRPKRGEVSMSPPVVLFIPWSLFISTNCRVSISTRHSIGHAVHVLYRDIQLIDPIIKKRESLIKAGEEEKKEQFREVFLFCFFQFIQLFSCRPSRWFCKLPNS
jgi:hypothetical protein